MSGDVAQRGYTPRELARLLRVSADRVRSWIRNGELRALNTSNKKCGKPRFTILPHHLAEFERGRAAGTPQLAPHKKRRSTAVDYYKD